MASLKRKTNAAGQSNTCVRATSPEKTVISINGAISFVNPSPEKTQMMTIFAPRFFFIKNNPPRNEHAITSNQAFNSSGEDRIAALSQICKAP